MTAPALPGAAPDPDRLPPEVERAIGKCCDAHGAYATARERGTIPQIDKAFKAAESAEAALRTAIARALGGDGEPVAWQIVDVKDGPTGYVGVTEDSAWARMEKATGCSRAEWAKERHARPLYEHPASDASARVDEAHRALGKPGSVDDDGCCTGCGRSVQPSPCCPDFPVWPGPCRSCYAYDAATGDTGEGDGALIGEAFGIIGHVVNHARRSTNIDGTRRRLGDDEACGRNWIALVDKCEALLATRAATGGPDAR